MTSEMDRPFDLQRKANQREAEMCDLLAIPAGRKLIAWSRKVRATWWYRFFSRFDPQLKEAK